MPNDAGILSVELSQSGKVTLRVEDNPAAWAQVRLIILERSNAAVLTGGEGIEIPFWEFAPIMPRLRTIVQLFPKLKVVFDQRTGELFKRSNEAARQIDNIDALAPVSEAQLLQKLTEISFGRTLTANQIRNVCRLAALPNGATFSVPGAGKTTEALATFAYKTGLTHKLLVVSPKNAFAAWDEQVAICLPGRTFTRLTGGRNNIATLLRANPPMALITYNQLVNVVDLIQEHLAKNPSVVFLDESHKIKGGEDKPTASAVLSISHLPEWKLIMTGTPMPNSPEDLIPQIRFLYSNIGAAHDPIATIQKFFVRTTKTELGLPPVVCTGIPIPLTDSQARLYRLCAAEVARDSEKALASLDKSLLRRIGQSYQVLLQLISNPALLVAHNKRFESEDLIACLQSDSPKISYVCHKARQLAAQGHKVLIWSGFVKNVEVISQRLADLGADFIHGGVDTGTDSNEEDQETRESKIARFHTDSKAMVLVANPAACAEGISLHTVCHHALYLDRNYNAAQFLQSADRIHRLGLPHDQKTFIEIVYSPGTIDESVDRRLKFKIDQMEEALQDKSINLPTHWIENIDELPDADDIRDLLQTLRGNEV
jgi:SNF2 family DNA or RNA helicase